MSGFDAKGPAAVVGIGATDFTRGSGREEWDLAIEAIHGALEDAGIDPRDVDGLIRSSYDSVDEAMVVRAFPMNLAYYGQVGYGGLGAPAVLGHAAAAISAGYARIVVCYRSLNGYSKTRYGRAERTLTDEANGIARGDRAPSGAFAGPYGLLSPGQVMAMWARRYQAMYGVSDGDMTAALGTVAVGQRHYASRNPKALMRNRPLDLDGYRNARQIYEPLRLNDFALESDGGVALVVAAPDIARASSKPPTWIAAAVQGLFRYAESISVYGPLRNSPRYLEMARRLYLRAGLGPNDVSVGMLYDATTVSVLLAVEAYGFAEVGKGWRWLADNGVGPDSPLPMNTSGGHLSEAYVHFFNMLAEGVRQCRGTAANQIADVSSVLCCSGPTAVLLRN
jgi:acetyl-CoA acetyltransferase